MTSHTSSRQTQPFLKSSSTGWSADLRSTAASSTDAVLEIVEFIIMWVLTDVREIRKKSFGLDLHVQGSSQSACARPVSLLRLSAKIR